jgi:GAF domain-containing protein
MVDRFRHLFDSLAEEVVVIDRELRISYANPAWMRRFNLEPGDVLGRPCYQLLLRADAPCAPEICAVQRVLKTGRPTRTELPACAQQTPGSRHELSSSPVLIKDRVQEVIQILHPLGPEPPSPRLDAPGQDSDRKLPETRALSGSEHELSTVFATVLDQVALVVDYDRASIALLDRTGWHIAVSRGFPLGADPDASLLGASDDILRSLGATRQALVISDLDSGTDLGPLQAQDGMHAWVAAPLLSQGEVVGALNLYKGTPGFYGSEDSAIAMAFASQAAVLLDNARLLEAERARAAQLGLLADLSQRVLSILDPKDLLDYATKAIQSRFGYYHVDVFLADEGFMRFQASSHVENAERWRAQGMRFRIGAEGIIGHVAGTGQVYLARDVAKDERYIGDSLLPETRSELAVPIKVGRQVVGVLDLNSDQLDAFDEADLFVAQSLADQLALALDNAQLYAAEARRRQEAETLQAATQALSSSLDLQQILVTILSELQKVVPYDSASVQQLEGHELEIIGGHGFPNVDQLVGVRFDIAASDNPNRQVLQTRAPLILEDAPAAYEGFSREPHAQAGIRSWLGVPLLFGDRLIGMLALDKQVPGFYTGEHARLALVFAAQAAIAIENARLFQETETRAREMAALAAVGRALTTLDLDDVLDSIAENALAAARAEISSVYLMDRDAGMLIPRSVRGLRQEELQQARFAMGEGTIGIVAASGKALLVPDTAKDPAFLPKSEAAERIHNSLTVPLSVKGRVIGTLETCNKVGGGGFTHTDQRLLSAFADQAAIAIENARLYEEVSRHLEEVQILNRVATAATATLDFDDMIRRSMAALLGLRHFERVHILLLRQDTQELWLHPALADTATFAQRADVRIPLGEGITGRVAKTGEALRVGNVHQEPSYVAGYEDTLSELCVPLRFGERTVGVLDVQSRQLDAFSEDDERLLSTLASHLSTLLENSRLFAETQHRVRELGSLMQVSQALNEAQDLETILNIVLEKAFMLTGSNEGSIILIDPPGSNRLRIVAERGLGAEVVEVFNSRPVYSHEGTYKRALDGGRMIEIHDTSSDPDFLHDVGSRAQTLTNVPLNTERGPIGLIAVDGICRDDTTRRLLSTLASMAAVAIDKERLYQETASRLAEVSTLYTLSTQITTSLSMRSVIESIVAILRLTLDCRSCSIFLLDATGEYLQLEAASGPSQTWKGIARLRLGEGVSGRVISERHPIYVPDTQEDPDFIFFNPQIRSLLVVPLIIRNRAIGTLSIDDARPNAFDDEMRLLSIAAAQAAVAIENAQLYESLENSYTELEAAYEELRQLDKMKSELVQNISHELRTPLTFIKGYVELLQDGEMGELEGPQRMAVDIVADKAEVLSKLVDDIISMQQAGREQLQFETLSLVELGHAAVKAAQASARTAGVQLIDDIGAETAPVLGDRRRLGQVFDNLLQNAIKFTPPGGTATVRIDEAEGSIRVEVQDSGIGIPADQLDRIFERFYQVDGTTTRRFGGAGLGLAIVKQIVEAHGGSVGVQSEPQQGSLFYFTIPVARTAEP